MTPLQLRAALLSAREKLEQLNAMLEQMDENLRGVQTRGSKLNSEILRAHRKMRESQARVNFERREREAKQSLEKETREAELR